MKRLLAITAVSLLASGAACAQGTCAKADVAKAEKAVDQASSWPQMQKAWQQYKQCDTGKVGEVFTETAIRLLVEWKNIDAMAAAMQDPAFKAFVFAHLATPEAKDDLDMVRSRAKSNCTSKHEALCGEIAEVTKSSAAK